MMTKSNALQFIGSFFRGENPFEETRQLSGHASSGISDIFISWFTQQTDEDKQVIAGVLAESVIESGELDDDLRQACFLMVEVAKRYPRSIPDAIVTKAEHLICKIEAVQSWLHDEEGCEDNLKVFRKRWRFALALWNLLWAVGSPVAAEMFTVFLEGAKDRHFSRSIKLAKDACRSR